MILTLPYFDASNVDDGDPTRRGIALYAQNVMFTTDGVTEGITDGGTDGDTDGATDSATVARTALKQPRQMF